MNRLPGGELTSADLYMRMAQEEAEAEHKHAGKGKTISGKVRPWSKEAFVGLVREIEHHDILGEGGQLNGFFMDITKDKWAEPLRWQKQALEIIEAAALDYMTEYFAKAACYCKV